MRLFRELQPAVVHTRNLAALEAVVPAWAAGVGARIHGEHGRNAIDPDGGRGRYQWVRRAYSPFVSRYVAVSQDLERYLHAWAFRQTVSCSSTTGSIRIDSIRCRRPYRDRRLPVS